ncbi:hypothetical protein HDU78_010744 [Chytriomyces hyalinus]|nr:hypothetical protein HDU78_010744 [Chytriomyces hyalinus]
MESGVALRHGFRSPATFLHRGMEGGGDVGARSDGIADPTTLQLQAWGETRLGCVGGKTPIHLFRAVKIFRAKDLCVVFGGKLREEKSGQTDIPTSKSSLVDKGGLSMERAAEGMLGIRWGGHAQNCASGVCSLVQMECQQESIMVGKPEAGLGANLSQVTWEGAPTG